MPSNIQVFVKWKDQTIFAGENVECTITFKNVADTTPEAGNGAEFSQNQRKASRVANHTGTPSDSFFSMKSPQSLFSSRRSHSISSQRKPFHRTASSLSSPLVASQSFPPPQWPLHTSNLAASGYAKARPHVPGPTLAESPNESAPSNLTVDTSHLGRSSPQSSRATSPAGPGEQSRTPSRRRQPPSFDFKFPAAPPTTEPNYHPRLSPSPKSTDRITPSKTKTSTKDASTLGAPSHQQLTRIISATSVNGSNRSSGEFYSVSNDSSETLASEYTTYSAHGVRAPPPPAARHARHYSSVAAPSVRPTDGQALLMVDGSLVDQSVFDEVKRKGVVGGQSGTGGLPGRPSSSSGDRARKGGGFWGSFKWNAIEESINGFLSNNELDGLREMRGVASSRSIPLLSTPQSLLFVDLRLSPGEEQSYSFSFSLPRGLPASHKGKAIKISYNLVIGTQRPSGPNESQRVNRINIPFRVFSGVNEKGDVLGHDLMSPYVILRDEAKVQKVGANAPVTRKPQSISTQWNTAGDFLSYVDEILEQRARSNTLFPPGALLSRKPSFEELPHSMSCKDIIDFAILRSNQAPNSRRSPNRFEIARDGQRIAVVVLNRPVHRLGETIIATVDFGNASIPCYAVRASLETSEKVTPTLAVRSNASIHRTTRRIHASLFENTLYATRVVFSPAIPITATPTILTSGVTLDWDLRFEFVTPTMHNEQGPSPSGTQLLETLSSDDRGKVMSAMEHLGCESFEISIPLTVYGETVREQVPEETRGTQSKDA
ncbi:uncharacterized protein N7477_008815 [Penicillium maclennaniae]|uniref:uncharacterized protein n=1 Tax=Penicillium maclennaniae TaxID=1343394 RepID=UPI002540821C|nr:uncharacterized protein N7477_008815 [Penicillium maclennaniae]KAJ5666367.1 hypothetical protein N7477_008815 [Penicillium maclennaniae]